MAGTYKNRGNAKQNSTAHGAEATISDYDNAILLMAALRIDLGLAWFQNLKLVANLRSAYQARAVARNQAGDAEGARKDENAAATLADPA